MDPHDTPGQRPSGLPYPLTPPTSREELPELRGSPGAPASWGLRAMARIIDFVLLSLPFSVLSVALGVEEVETGSGQVELEGPLWTLLLFPLAFMAYEAVTVSRTGQTLGKWMCQIKVVDWRTGGLPSLSDATTRAVVPGVFLLIGSAQPLVGVPWLGWMQLVPVLIYLTAVVSPVYRGVHDRAASTIVLTAPRARRRAV